MVSIQLHHVCIYCALHNLSEALTGDILADTFDAKEWDAYFDNYRYVIRDNIIIKRLAGHEMNLNHHNEEVVPIPVLLDEIATGKRSTPAVHPSFSFS